MMKKVLLITFVFLAIISSFLLGYYAGTQNLFNLSKNKMSMQKQINAPSKTTQLSKLANATETLEKFKKNFNSKMDENGLNYFIKDFSQSDKYSYIYKFENFKAMLHINLDYDYSFKSLYLVSDKLTGLGDMYIFGKIAAALVYAVNPELTDKEIDYILEQSGIKKFETGKTLVYQKTKYELKGDINTLLGLFIERIN